MVRKGLNKHITQIELRFRIIMVQKGLNKNITHIELRLNFNEALIKIFYKIWRKGVRVLPQKHVEDWKITEHLHYNLGT